MHLPIYPFAIQYSPFTYRSCCVLCDVLCARLKYSFLFHLFLLPWRKKMHFIAVAFHLMRWFSQVVTKHVFAQNLRSERRARSIFPWFSRTLHFPLRRVISVHSSAKCDVQMWWVPFQLRINYVRTDDFKIPLHIEHWTMDRFDAVFNSIKLLTIAWIEYLMRWMKF